VFSLLFPAKPICTDGADIETFTVNDNNGFPVGTIVISTEKQWEDFKSKYLYGK
jgi:hypothetical protein